MTTITINPRLESRDSLITITIHPSFGTSPNPPSPKLLAPGADIPGPDCRVSLKTLEIPKIAFH
jgi:hypothetical protein